MRTALLSDIHGNREALAACLAHIDKSGVDRIMFLGDIIGYGADPEWCLEAVMKRCDQGAIALLGNHDEAALKPSEDMNGMARAAMDWTRRRLSSDHLKFIEERPILKEEGDVLYVHASAAAPHSWLYIQTPRDAENSLSFTTRRITICGHVHVPRYFHALPAKPCESYTPTAGVPMPLLRQRRWVIVLGAVGQPRDGNPAAAYSIIDTAQGHVTLHRVPYNIEGAAQKIRAAGLPVALADRLFKGS